MIARITGQLIQLDAETNTLLLEVGEVAYELMVPGYAVSDLSDRIGHAVTLYCLQYLEGNATGGNLIPRLIGFPQQSDKVFFQRFITVKGVGMRKALRALAKPLGDIAYSIEDGDVKMLTTLPEIGKRTAEQIVAELKGKLASFAEQAAQRPGVAREPLTDAQREALEILLQLGERRSDAEDLIARAADAWPEVASTDALVQAVYRLKAGAMP